MTLNIYNSLTHSKQPFVPLEPDYVGLYVCGPTVYGPPHIGNARSAVVFDVLYRVLKSEYKQVTYVRNITDIDDKINAAAQAQGVPIEKITDKYMGVYQDNLAALGCLAPDHEPRVTEHMDEIIHLISRLLDSGHAYQAEGHVLFDAPSFKDYGKLSRRDDKAMLAGARVEVADYKKHPGDFVLWKPSSSEQPGWKSPWGNGRPGWHIECTAMAEKYLGKTIDIHGGGQDLIFPHHENEIAQGTCAHDGDPYCRYWVHNGFVQVDQQKMSKSLGNILLVDELLKQVSGETMRLALLSTHYSQPLDWSEHAMLEANKTLHRWYTALDKQPRVCLDGDSEINSAFSATLKDNLNTPQALYLLHQWFKNLSKLTAIQFEGQFDGQFESQSKSQALNLDKCKKIKADILAAGQFLGIFQEEPKQWLEKHKQYKADKNQRTEQEIMELVSQRNQARKQRDFTRADLIREQLSASGIILDDKPEGTNWHYQ